MTLCICLNILSRRTYMEQRRVTSAVVGPFRRAKTAWHETARPLTCRSNVLMVPENGIEEIDEFLKTRTYTATPNYRLSLIRRKYAKEGASSGIDPGIMWPTKEELKARTEEDLEFEPSLKQMQDELLIEKQEREQKELAKAKAIEDGMKKMPSLIKDFKKKQLEKFAEEEAAKEKRQRLLEEAKEKMGYAIDPRNPRFQQMLADIEKEEKRKKKELKKKGIVVD
ncbi:large ribosomal subunit protein mL64-like [Antedon mediterranea]|uniref:large ribosomal subunit protein mL64-like n=1 Tax=Antedon mediterranea TaxID=105859 RepID=UPI003AF88068